MAALAAFIVPLDRGKMHKQERLLNWLLKEVDYTSSICACASFGAKMAGGLSAR